MHEQRRESREKQQAQDDVAMMVLDGLTRAAWAARVELALLAPSLALFGWLWLHVGWTPRAAGIAAALPWVPVVAWGGSRRWVWLRLRRASVRRDVLGAFKAAGTFLTFQPRVVKVRELPGGDAVTLELPRGGTASDVEKSAESIASSMQVREVKVAREASNARRVQLVVVRRDFLAERVLPWPWADRESVSLWEAFPVGVGDDGRVVMLCLVERNALNGGEPGGGKSGNVNLICAVCALDPDVELYLLDGKMVELAAWRDCADGWAGVSVAEANALLCELQAEMEARYAWLLEIGKRKVERGDGPGLAVVVVDELAHYLTNGTKDERAEFADRLRDLVSRGRAAGVIVIAATQKPSSDVIPTALRDLFGYRWAMRCTTPQASDTILGAGWASQGYSAADIDPAARGVGWLLHEGGVPVRLRSYWLDDDAIRAIARRAAALRGRKGGRGAG
jgi:hypothetical protein